MVKVIATPLSYTNSVHVVFNENECISKYELYRDGVKIATSENEEGKSDFSRPTVFDHDHHTNLFRKESNHQLMYKDTSVARFREYAYQVIYWRDDMSWSSNIAFVTLQ